MHLLRITAIIALLLSGCGRATPVTPCRTTTTALTATRTVTSTATRAPTRRPSETHTAARNPCPTITAVFSVVNNSLSPIADLRGFSGEWSPKANQMAGIIWEDEETGYLNIITAPDFEQNRILQERVFFGEAIFGHDLAWSPDGNAIVFDGPAEFGPVRDLSTPWAVSSNGQVTKQILQHGEPERWVQFPGWQDDQTMILSSYMGGDTHHIRLVDFESGQVLAQENIPGKVFPGLPSGIPFEYHVSPSKIGVITITQQSERQGRVSYVRMLPERDGMLPPEDRVMHVLGWRPETEKLLVSVETIHPPSVYMSAAQVVEWDLRTDTIDLLAQKAGYAEYSPDGRWLALLSYGGQALTPGQTIDRQKPAEAKETAVMQLYLVDPSDGTVKLHFSISTESHDPRVLLPNRTPRAAFSPDGRYLAFITHGITELNPRPLDEELSYSRAMLNVLDLETFQITVSTPTIVDNALTSSMAWSPGGEDLFYFADRYGPAVMDVTGDKLTVLSVDSSMNVEMVAWSHDGTFLSLQASQPQSYQSSDTLTLIYKIK